MERTPTTNISRKLKEKSYKDYIENKLMVLNVENTLLLLSSSHISHSRRTAAVEVIL